MAIFNSYVSLPEGMFIAIFDDPRVWVWLKQPENTAPWPETAHWSWKILQTCSHRVAAEHLGLEINISRWLQVTMEWFYPPEAEVLGKSSN